MLIRPVAVGTITALFTAIATADNLVLYYPVYPQYAVPKHLQSFERNAPPRIFAKDPDVPSSGIVFLRKDLGDSRVDWKAQPQLEKTRSSSRPKLQSDRGTDEHQQASKPDTRPIKSLQTTVPQFVVTKEIDYAQYDTDKIASAPFNTNAFKVISPALPKSTSQITSPLPRSTTPVTARTNPVKVQQQPQRNIRPIRIFTNFDPKTKKQVMMTREQHPQTFRRKEYSPRTAIGKSGIIQLSKAYRVETKQKLLDNEVVRGFAQGPIPQQRRPTIGPVTSYRGRTAVTAPRVFDTKIVPSGSSKITLTTVVDGDATVEPFRRFAMQRLL